MKAFNKTSYMCFRIYFRPDVYGVNAFIFPTNSIHNIVEKLLYKYNLSFFSYILKLTFTGTDFHTLKLSYFKFNHLRIYGQKTYSNT